MKNERKIISIILALVLALALCAAALAETVDTPADQPAAEEPAADTALQDALKALEEARKSDKATDLEAELKAYVEAGKLTQEQADLILKAYKDQEALRNGVCPNCGYEFESGFGKGGRGNKGGRTNIGKDSRQTDGNTNGFGSKGGRGNFGRQQNGAGQDAVTGPTKTPDQPTIPEGSGT